MLLFVGLCLCKEVRQLPKHYNFLEEHPECDFGPMYQRCGSCYAHAAIKSLSHRFCLALGRKVELSPQYAIACDIADNGCRGGSERNTYYFMEQHGVTDVNCHPWEGVTSYNQHYCSTCSKSDGEMRLYRAKYWSTKHFEGVEEIQRELYENGPLSVCISCDFALKTYKDGIYVSNNKGYKEAGNHSLELIGWGESDNHEQYWILSNNYGTSWGMNGLMYMRRGTDEALVESFVYGAVPDV